MKLKDLIIELSKYDDELEVCTLAHSDCGVDTFIMINRITPDEEFFNFKHDENGKYLLID